MCKTIKEIFDFGNNAAYHYFFSRLKNNIQDYIRQQYSTKAIPSFFVLDIDKLIDIVKYCITHGFDENARKAIQEQNKSALKETPKEVAPREVVPEKPKERPRVVFVETVKNVEPPKDEFAHIKSKVSTFL
jgi:hypothetical protein